MAARQAGQQILAPGKGKVLRLSPEKGIVAWKVFKIFSQKNGHMTPELNNRAKSPLMRAVHCSHQDPPPLRRERPQNTPLQAGSQVPHLF
ncbi:hypothetical protein Y1Q_0021652 [Alligator mississippiensis]|uniref:Uncharacterized protein n=1 Tax=Alligator mississippiensis TaxID=8496 RepID=A0A151PBF0_ALLMI|nr:hypothetical protein Y1Q_0021652 [Alligator mississippiensis]